MQTPLQIQLLSQGKFSAADLACIAQCRGAPNRLGFAYQLAFARLFNYFPSQQSFATLNELLTFVSLQLHIEVSVIRAYSQRRETVPEHQERIRLYLGLSRFSAENVPEVERFIFEEASRVEETSLLLAQTKRFLQEHHILEPSDSTLHRLIPQQRQHARTQIFAEIAAAVSPTLREQLNPLVTTSETESARRSTLHLLKQPPGRPSPASLLKLTGKLEGIKTTGVLQCDLSWLNNNFQRSLARYARQCTASRLRELQPEHCYAVLVCFLHQLYRDTIDALVDMYKSYSIRCTAAPSGMWTIMPRHTANSSAPR